MIKKDLTGKTFGNLTVIKETSSTRRGMTHWECVCSCGTVKICSLDHLTRKIKPIKSCGCLRRLKGPNHKDWKGFGEISGQWWNQHVTRELSVGNNRFRLNVTLTIREAWELFLKQDRKCALSGLPLQISNKGTASIDRIDSSRGYELGNVQWVHKHINFMKRDFQQDYFLEMCSKITNYKMKDR